MDAPIQEAPVTPVAPTDAEQLISFVRTREVACPLCGYNLRGLEQPRCPECGRALRLSVALREPAIGAWILLASATVAAGGIGALFLAMVIKEGWRFVAFEPWMLTLTICFFIAMLPVAAAVLLLRRRFQRLSSRTRWGWAQFVSGVCLAAFIALVAYIR